MVFYWQFIVLSFCLGFGFGCWCCLDCLIAVDCYCGGGCGNGGCCRFFAVAVESVLGDLGWWVSAGWWISGLVPSGLCLFCWGWRGMFGYALG